MIDSLLFVADLNWEWHNGGGGQPKRLPHTFARVGLNGVCQTYSLQRTSVLSLRGIPLTTLFWHPDLIFKLHLSSFQCGDIIELPDGRWRIAYSTVNGLCCNGLCCFEFSPKYLEDKIREANLLLTIERLPLYISDIEVTKRRIV